MVSMGSSARLLSALDAGPSPDWNWRITFERFRRLPLEADDGPPPEGWLRLSRLPPPPVAWLVRLRRLFEDTDEDALENCCCCLLLF